MSGRKVSGCRLERVCSKSEHSELYKAWSEELQRDVMIKVLSARFPPGSRTAKRFLRGGKLAVNLEHPNIVRTFSAGEDRGRPHMLMEFVPGHSLDKILSVREKLPYEVATGIVRQVAKALQAASLQNIVHRGIEPSHIMLSPGGRAKVLGFGLARLAEATDAGITAEGALVNVGPYSPPETGDGVQDIRGDIYSLGCVFYQLLSGKLPFTGRDPLELLHHHRSSDYWPIFDLVDGLPEAISGVVDAMLEKRLVDRVRDPSELIHLLDAAVNPEILGAQGIKPDKTLVIETRSILAMRGQSSVLVCDGQEYNLKALQETVAGLGVNVLTTRNGKAAIQTMREREVDLVLTDTKLPGLWGAPLLEEITGVCNGCKVILTRRGELAEMLYRQPSFNIIALLDRPLEMQAVRDTVQQSLQS